jgi:hypothetical protein
LNLSRGHILYSRFNCSKFQHSEDAEARYNVAGSLTTWLLAKWQGQ